MLEHGKIGGMKEGTIEVCDRWIRTELRGAGSRVWWSEMGKAFYAQDYVDRVESILSESAA
jgi:hypothetical protein